MNAQQLHLHIARLVIDEAALAGGRPTSELMAQAIRDHLSDPMRSHATLAQSIAGAVGQRLAAVLPHDAATTRGGDGSA